MRANTICTAFPYFRTAACAVEAPYCGMVTSTGSVTLFSHVPASKSCRTLPTVFDKFKVGYSHRRDRRFHWIWRDQFSTHPLFSSTARCCPVIPESRPGENNPHIRWTADITSTPVRIPGDDSDMELYHQDGKIECLLLSCYKRVITLSDLPPFERAQAVPY